MAKINRFLSFKINYELNNTVEGGGQGGFQTIKKLKS